MRWIGLLALFIVAPFAGEAAMLQNVVILDAPDARTTVPLGINANGDVVGYFEDSRRVLWGFLYEQPTGEFTKFRPPGVGESVYASGINASRLTVGTFSTGSINNHFYLRSPDGTYSSFDYPQIGYTGSFAGINDLDQIVGSFAPAGEDYLGFIRSADGTTFTTFRVPGAPETEAFGINNAGEVVGRYEPTAGSSLGFIRNSDGSFTTFRNPDNSLTLPRGINNNGTVVSNDNSRRSFLRLSNGEFYTLEIPGASAVEALAISDTNRIVGTYCDPQSCHGFAGQFTLVPEPGTLHGVSIAACLGLGVCLWGRRRTQA